MKKNPNKIILDVDKLNKHKTESVLISFGEGEFRFWIEATAIYDSGGQMLDAKEIKKKTITEKELIEYIGFYLSETVENLTDWDCEHLAINLMRELRIEKSK